jgi:hypothetical protein
MGEHSPYVGKGPAVDAAWNAISYDSMFYLSLQSSSKSTDILPVGDQMIRPEDLPLIDMPSSSLMVKHPVTGVEGYRVGLEVFHQLHCINLLRQVTYKEHYQAIGNGNFAVDEKELQLHTGMALSFIVISESARQRRLFFIHNSVTSNLNRTDSFYFRPLPGDPPFKRSMQRRCRRLHFLHARWRPTPMA